MSETPTQLRPIEVLLIEDDDDDVRLTKKSFERDRLFVRLNRVEDGVEALAYLRRESGYADSVRPDLILLDLNMPRMDGRQTLQAIKEDEDLRTIPVVVLTTSEDEADVFASYQHQANSYITKPVDLMQFRSVLQAVGQYWFSVVRLPPSAQSESVRRSAANCR